MAPYWQVRPLLDAGRVELLLPQYEPPLLPVHLLWHGGARLPLRSRLLVDFLAMHFRDDVI
jgi:DNA-binding transcriptional LysR family regulator